MSIVIVYSWTFYWGVEVLAKSERRAEATKNEDTHLGRQALLPVRNRFVLLLLFAA
jgi:hypothetical protein